MKTATTLVLISLAVLLALTPAQADDMDIFGANIQPNVMILIDSSQSMNDPVTSIPYDNNLSPAAYPVVNRCGPNSRPAVHDPGGVAADQLQSAHLHLLPEHHRRRWRIRRERPARPDRQRLLVGVRSAAPTSTCSWGTT